MSTVEQITEHVRQLPEDAQREVLDFVDFLLQKHGYKPPKSKRLIGLAKGEFSVPDTFFDPLPEEMEGR